MWHIGEEENWVWLQVFLIYLKMLQVILLHNFIVAVAVVYQVVAHIVDWALYKWSLVPHTPNWVVAVAEEPFLLPLLNQISLMLNIASYLSASCCWRFRCCCCWPWISASHHHCCRCICRTQSPASHTTLLKTLLLLMLNLAPRLIPLLQMLLLLMFNLASYLSLSCCCCCCWTSL